MGILPRWLENWASRNSVRNQQDIQKDCGHAQRIEHVLLLNLSQKLHQMIFFEGNLNGWYRVLNGWPLGFDWYCSLLFVGGARTAASKLLWMSWTYLQTVPTFLRHTASRVVLHCYTDEWLCTNLLVSNCVYLQNQYTNIQLHIGSILQPPAPSMVMSLYSTPPPPPWWWCR